MTLWKKDLSVNTVFSTSLKGFLISTVRRKDENFISLGIVDKL